MKRCPYCAEKIQSAAVICRYCGLQQPAAAITPHSGFWDHFGLIWLWNKVWWLGLLFGIGAIAYGCTDAPNDFAGLVSVVFGLGLIGVVSLPALFR